MLITKSVVSRKHYDNVVDKLVRVNGMSKTDATIWADRKFVISLGSNDLNKTVTYQSETKKCKGCQEIWARINKGHDGYFTCPDCGKEIEWGT